MNRRQLLATAIAATVASAAASPAAGTPTDLPALFADDTAWLNSTPLTATDLTGHPVLVEFWTHGCSNCRNTLPWMKAIDAKYAARGLEIVAVHTPEFSPERDPAAIREALARLDIRYPVMLDPQGRYWRALDNRYWPAFYLFDSSHALAATRIGELHAGEPSADAFEQTIARLLSR